MYEGLSMKTMEDKRVWENTIERTLVSCCSTHCIISQQSVILGVSLSVGFKD